MCNRVHDGGERLSENHGTNGARSTLDGHSEVKQRSYTGFPAFISHNSHPLQLTTGKLGLVKFSHIFPYSSCFTGYTPIVTLSFTSGFAPAVSKSLTILWWPFKLARSSAVHPFCMSKWEEYSHIR